MLNASIPAVATLYRFKSPMERAAGRLATGGGISATATSSATSRKSGTSAARANANSTSPTDPVADAIAYLAHGLRWKWFEELNEYHDRPAESGIGLDTMRYALGLNPPQWLKGIDMAKVKGKWRGSGQYILSLNGLLECIGHHGGVWWTVPRKKDGTVGKFVNASFVMSWHIKYAIDQINGRRFEYPQLNEEK